MRYDWFGDSVYHQLLVIGWILTRTRFFFLYIDNIFKFNDKTADDDFS